MKKWNEKAKNTLFRGLCKDVFNLVRNQKDSCIMVGHMWTPWANQEQAGHCYHIVMKRLNYFEIHPHESVNDMYSWLKALMEEVNGLRLT